MNWNNIRLILFREVRDQLRDRRTVFMIAVLPILLYPFLGLGLVQLTVLFAERPQTVGIVGVEHLPPSPPLLSDGYFHPHWFDHPESSRLLKVIPFQTEAAGLRAFNERRIQVLISIPREFGQRWQLPPPSPWLRALQVLGNALRQKWSPKPETPNNAFALGGLSDSADNGPRVFRNTADDRSRFTYEGVRQVLARWQRALSQERAARAGLPRDVASPQTTKLFELSKPGQSSLWPKVFPFLLVMMTLSGAFYPAVDLCAGEKERGTMETLLISPAARRDIVMGKFCTITLVSTVTAALNLLSMGLTGWLMASWINQSVGRAGTDNPILGHPPALALVWIGLALPLLAMFFSALSLALSAFARSTKEAQYYLMPLFLATMPLTMLIIAPGVELDLFYSLVPITSVALLLKSLLLMQYDVAVRYVVPVMATTVLYSYLGLRWAQSQFHREEVLFREAERLDLGLWIRHLLRDKEPTPSTSEAAFCFVLIMLTLWFAALLSPPPSGTVDILRALAIHQVAFIAAPALLMAVLLTSSPRQTLRLRIPPLNMMLVAVVLAVAAHPLVIEMGLWIDRLIPLESRIKASFEALMRPGPWQVGQLLVIAALPAVCEELAFRGFILSGLLRGRSPLRAIVITSVLFGLVHMLLQQGLIAFALGIILGLLVVRSQSLLPAVLFHFTNNALALGMSWGTQGEGEIAKRWETMLRSVPEGESSAYAVPVLLASAVIVGLLLAYLVKPPGGERRLRTSTSTELTPEVAVQADPQAAGRS